MDKDMIYLDHAATTYVYPELIKSITEDLAMHWGNPSALYSFGEDSFKIINQARAEIAECVGADPDEIYFTSGSSEGNAWALAQSNRCLCSPYEHHNILNNPNSVIIDKDYLTRAVFCARTELSPEETEPLFKEKLLSWMYVNNETGEIFDLDSLRFFARSLGMYFHSDMTQALGNVPINLHELGVDIATFSGHKIHTPKGVGFIYFNKKTLPSNKIEPLIYGGNQESGVRAGTENVPYIHALAGAVKRATSEVDKKQSHCKKLKLAFIEALHNCPVDYIIVSPANSINSTLAVCFKWVEGEFLQSCLSEDNTPPICIGTGSACASGDMEPSHVLSAMGISEEYIRGLVRLSFDLTNTEDEVVQCAESLKLHLEGLTSV